MLEEGFQDGINPDPERKTKLSRELGRESRQVAFWFQNRHARRKTKQMEPLYDDLRPEFYITCKEKSKLQEEVIVCIMLHSDSSVLKITNSVYAIVKGFEVEGHSPRSSCREAVCHRVLWNETVGSNPPLPFPSSSEEGLRDDHGTYSSVL